MKIGFITDLHFRQAVAGTSAIAKRECRRVGELLDRCFEAFVTEGVDLVVCAGDCLDEPDLPGVEEDLAALRDRFAATGLRSIVIPGNHDPAPEQFYRLLPQPPRITRIQDCELLTFFDDVPEEGSVRARRADELLELMRRVLAEDPPEVAQTVLIQHYVVYPEYAGTGYPHQYANDAVIRGIMEQSPRRLVSLSGHCHAGHALEQHNGVTYFTGRALCEFPYPYYLLHVDGPSLRIEARAIATGRLSGSAPA